MSILPNEKEIEEIMDKTSKYCISNHDGVAKAIAERISLKGILKYLIRTKEKG